MLGHDENVEAICDGGFSLDVRYAATRLRELCKMDGAVVLSTDGSRIVRANVQLVPDPSIPTDESGTRHRSAERAAIQTGYPVISVSHSMNIVTVYVRGERHVLTDSATILSRANQAIATLERYKTRLDEVSRQPSRAEIEDFVTLRDVMTVVQRLELVRRIGLVIDYDVVELGTDGRQLRLQLDELLGGNDTARELIVRDYHANPEPPSTGQINATLDELDALSDGDLLDFTALAKVFGYPTTTEAQDSTLSPRGYRAMAGIPGSSSPMPTCWSGRSERCRVCWRPAPAICNQWTASAPCGPVMCARGCHSWRNRPSAINNYPPCAGDSGGGACAGPGAGTGPGGGGG